MKKLGLTCSKFKEGIDLLINIFKIGLIKMIEQIPKSWVIYYLELLNLFQQKTPRQSLSLAS